MRCVAKTAPLSKLKKYEILEMAVVIINEKKQEIVGEFTLYFR